MSAWDYDYLVRESLRCEVSSRQEVGSALRADLGYGRRRAAEGRGVATPRPPKKECTMNRAPT